MTIIKNARIIKNGAIEENSSVAFENGVIVAVPKRIPKDAEVIDAKGRYVSAGFVDIHTHGGGGHDFLDATEEAFRGAATLHAKYGTTTLLPTATSASLEETIKMMAAYEAVKANNETGADMPGLHFEGPYFSPQQCGAQDPKYLRNPEPEEYNKILGLGSKIIRWSMAPELDGALEFGKVLTEKGILASIGHSDAEFDEVERAFEVGFTHLTHFYSAMSTVHRKNAYRYAGVVESGYLIDGMTVEIIADGKHLPKELLQMIYRFIGPERTALVTDSMRGAGMKDGETPILGSLTNGIETIIEDGVAKMPDRSCFAGSVATMDRLVRNMINMANANLCDAVKMASETPCKIVGLTDRGTLEVGKRADIVIFDDNINVKRTIVGGNTVFCE